MPGIQPGQPIAPGIATGNTFPQWGVKMSADQKSGTIIKATSQAAKTADAKQGYLTWFTSQQAAKDFISSETSAFNGNVPAPLSGLAAIGDFFHRLTEAHTWLRVAEFLVGGAFLIIGLNALLHNPAGQVAKIAAKVPV